MTQEEERERERERISLTLNDQLIGAAIYLCAVYLKGNRKIDTIVTKLGHFGNFLEPVATFWPKIDEIVGQL